MRETNPVLAGLVQEEARKTGLDPDRLDEARAVFRSAMASIEQAEAQRHPIAATELYRRYAEAAAKVIKAYGVE